MHVFAAIATAVLSHAEPRLIGHLVAADFPTSHTIQGVKSIATFNRGGFTDVVEVDVISGRMSRRKIPGAGWIYASDSNHIVMHRTQTDEPVDNKVAERL